MVKTSVKIEREVDVKTFHIHLKCRDEFTMRVDDADGDVLKHYEGYVPSVVPGDYGDYLNLVIDVETGMIKNWRKPTSQELKEFLNDGDND